MEVFRVSEAQIAEGIVTPEFRGLMRCEVDYARSLFEEGLPLIGKVSRDLALDLDLFSRGGLEVLRAIERQDYDVLTARPAISKSRKLALALRAVSGKLLPFLRSAVGSEDGVTQSTLSDELTLDRAYAACRAIARREAKNFYYAFVALPARAATLSAPSTPSCAAPTIWPTTNPSPATNAAAIWPRGWPSGAVSAPVASQPIRLFLPCAIAPRASIFPRTSG